MIAFIFPGQGSQRVGMGKALAEARPEAAAVFAEVDEALGKRAQGEAVGGGEVEQVSCLLEAPALPHW